MASIRKRQRKFGPGFGDMIEKSSNKVISDIQSKEGDFYSFWPKVIFGKALSALPQKIEINQIRPFYVLTALLFSIIIFRLFFLQVIYGKENLNRSEQNRIHFRTLHAPRGEIFDRNGEILSRSTAAFRLIKDKNVQLIDKDTALELETKNLVSEGVDVGELGRIEIDASRIYHPGDAFGHVIGYVSQISQQELNSSYYKQYSIGDRVGRLGIEESYESNLKGKDGRELIETDSKGTQIKILGSIPPTQGDNISTTLDLNLQKKSYESLSKTAQKHNSKGAVVIQDPKSGAILSLVSFPSFDNNIFTDPNLDQKYQQLASDLRLPFLNRATLGLYPPGSVFKIVSALAGLESGKINKDTQIEDVGEIFLGPFRFANWFFDSYGKKEGMLDLKRAIARSNDIYFYRIGQYVGEKYLADIAFKLGLGKKSGIDLPGEEKGLVPTPEWKKAAKGEVWVPGNTLHMAIGQGDVLTTPLQIANITSFVASDGLLYQPYLVSKIVNSDGKLVKENEPKILANNIASKENINYIKEGMRQACETGGTAWPFFDFTVKKLSGESVRIPVGCKTGTAEFGISHPHAWFTIFAPFDNPEIVVTVIIEEAGEGSSVAAPVAKEILEWYFSKN